jgi:hypothetical protein
MKHSLKTPPFTQEELQLRDSFKKNYKHLHNAIASFKNSQDEANADWLYIKALRFSKSYERYNKYIEKMNNNNLAE